jgi:hypothetical protein
VIRAYSIKIASLYNLPIPLLARSMVWSDCFKNGNVQMSDVPKSTCDEGKYMRTQNRQARQLRRAHHRSCLWFLLDHAVIVLAKSVGDETSGLS